MYRNDHIKTETVIEMALKTDTEIIWLSLPGIFPTCPPEAQCENFSLKSLSEPMTE